MQEEGVIKFDLRFTQHAPLSLEPFAELNHWRTVLWQQGLIGQEFQACSSGVNCKDTLVGLEINLSISHS